MVERKGKQGGNHVTSGLQKRKRTRCVDCGVLRGQLLVGSAHLPERLKSVRAVRNGGTDVASPVRAVPS